MEILHVCKSYMYCIYLIKTKWIEMINLCQQIKVRFQVTVYVMDLVRVLVRVLVIA